MGLGKYLGEGFLCYSKTQRLIQTNGFVSKYIVISHSIRQGCSIAAMLYILQDKPFAATIRGNPNTQGIHLQSRAGDGIEVKLNIFADDT